MVGFKFPTKADFIVSSLTSRGLSCNGSGLFSLSTLIIGAAFRPCPKDPDGNESRDYAHLNAWLSGQFFRLKAQSGPRASRCLFHAFYSFGLSWFYHLVSRTWVEKFKC